MLPETTKRTSTSIHAFLALAWFAGMITTTRQIAGYLRRPFVVQVFDRLTGGIFIAVGVLLALETRRL
jgi:threonine/homoserine/homoserine lactone efflux protein